VFSVLMGFGVLVSLGWVSWHAAHHRALDVFDQGLVLLTCTLFSSRAGYVAAHWGYFELQRWEIPQVWLGGLSGWGAVFGWLIGGWLSAIFFGESAGRILDRLFLLGAYLAGVGWLGAWVDGSAYGFLAEGAWWGLPAVDEQGVWLQRFPVQLLGALLVAGLWIGLESWARGVELPPGLPTCFGLVGLGLIFLVLSSLRVDETIVWRNLRLDAWAGMGIILAGALGVVWIGMAHWVYLRRSGT
jgi:prolipoprotein diacylglyceryltransferase